MYCIIYARISVHSSTISLPLTPAPKKSTTPAERQRAYKLRQKQKILNNPEEKRKILEKKLEYQRQYRLKKKLKKTQNINEDKPIKKSRADYQREYRLRKKLKAKLNSGSAEMIASQKAGSSDYLASVTTAHLTQSSCDEGPIIIQHEAVIETVEFLTANRKKKHKRAA